jgi:site-specific DNA-methyltransferase (adenine-specific)
MIDNATISTVGSVRHWERLGPRGYCRKSAVGVGQPTRPVELPRRAILLGDATERLRELPSDSIDCAITSPPYFQLRDYFTSGQIGLEPKVGEWVKDLRAVFDQVARVLKPAGTLWLNLGDSFSRHEKYGAPSKSLLCAPERLLLALSDDGWIIRNKVVWAKPNPLPSSVSDRLNLSYEVVYLLTRGPHYFFDLDAIREPHRTTRSKRKATQVAEVPAWAGPLAGKQDGLRRARAAGLPGHPLGKNPGDVWTIPTQSFHGPHFATFPPELVRRPLLATCPEAVCTRCGKPRRRQVTATGTPTAGPYARRGGMEASKSTAIKQATQRAGELIRCSCNAPSIPGVVLDPFMGAGTVGLVAERLGRDWIGIELNPEFRDLATKRIEDAR